MPLSATRVVDETLVLRDVLLAGARVDVVVAGGVVRECAPGAANRTAARATTLPLEGWCVLPALAEPHAHLDKAFLIERTGHCDGDVRHAVQVVKDVYDSIDEEEITVRARRATAEALRHGVTALRSHVDVGGEIGSRALDALCALRNELVAVMDVQLVALSIDPVSGPEGARARRFLEATLERGADVIGGGPWLDVEPLRTVDELTALAASSGRPLDLHVDETTETAVLTLERLVRRVEALGLGGRVTASHCVSLAHQDSTHTAQLVAELAAVGISVVTLPQTNLYLQGRTASSTKLRGIPPLDALGRAGVLVAAGGDNWRDPFNPLGRIDPLETAALLVAAGHVTPTLAYEMVSERARAVMALPPAVVRPGDAADLVCIRVSGPEEAVASACEERIVLHRGRVVARSELTVSGALWPQPGGSLRAPPQRGAQRDGAALP